jgi:hypothetical protein
MNLRAESSTQFLRRALFADGIVSGLSGLLLLLLPGPIASVLGLASSGLVAAVGASLVLFAAFVLRSARREMPHRGEAALIVALNVAWVVGSVAVIAGSWLTTMGDWAVALVADVVLVFAILESVGLRKLAATAAAGSRASGATA